MDFISASQINSYLLCPRKYKYRYIDGIPPAFKSSALAFGSSVHTALSWLHEELLAGNTPPLEEVLRIFRADWTAAQEERIRFKKAEKENLPRIGERLIELYIEHMGKMHIRATEMPFEVRIIDPRDGEVTNLWLKGYFDLLLEGGRLIEIKTSATSYSQMKADQLVQLDAYAFAYREIYGSDPQLTVIDLVKAKTPKLVELGTERTPDRDLWFCELALQVAKGIDHEVFPPNPGWVCSDCEYSGMCREVGAQECASAPF
jgi:CRISPR/Cas system-associated exonuclease Cas4 (RecB family)